MVRHSEFEKPSLLSSRQVSGGEGYPSVRFGVDSGSSTATRSWLRSSAGTISAPAAPGSAFKSCCLRSGDFDGSERDDYSR